MLRGCYCRQSHLEYSTRLFDTKYNIFFLFYFNASPFVSGFLLFFFPQFSVVTIIIVDVIVKIVCMQYKPISNVSDSIFVSFHILSFHSHSSIQHSKCGCNVRCTIYNVLTVRVKKERIIVMATKKCIRILFGKIENEIFNICA